MRTKVRSPLPMAWNLCWRGQPHLVLPDACHRGAGDNLDRDRSVGCGHRRSIDLRLVCAQRHCPCGRHGHDRCGSRVLLVWMAWTVASLTRGLMGISGGAFALPFMYFPPLTCFLCRAGLSCLPLGLCVAHSYFVASNTTTWEASSQRDITYLKGAQALQCQPCVVVADTFACQSFFFLFFLSTCDFEWVVSPLAALGWESYNPFSEGVASNVRWFFCGPSEPREWRIQPGGS